MRDELNELGLKVEVTKRGWSFNEGLGKAYLHSLKQKGSKRYRRQIFACAATCLRRAAANAILIDETNSAKELFGLSAQAYEELGRPYAVIMWILAGQTNKASESMAASLKRLSRKAYESSSETIQQSIYPMLFEAALRGADNNLDEERNSLSALLSKELRANGRSPLGVLGIPVIHHVSLFEALQNGESKEMIIEALSPFLAAYDSAVRTAGSDAYHWQKLAFPFHPVEPDILGFLVIANQVLLRHESSAIEVVSKSGLSGRSRTLLEDALTQWSSPPALRHPNG